MEDLQIRIQCRLSSEAPKYKRCACMQVECAENLVRRRYWVMVMIMRMNDDKNKNVYDS